jgi:hypothetical protein
MGVGRAGHFGLHGVRERAKLLAQAAMQLAQAQGALNPKADPAVGSQTGNSMTWKRCLETVIVNCESDLPN